ncbi:MAG: heme-binding protein, partial [Actinobacteria bacterium]|nr:heme-binding protein [Actinomycetota bacterium]
VKVIEVPAHNAAARRFSGSWNEERFESEGKALLEAVAAEGLASKGSLYFSRFDPPWKPGFLKRNEVLIQVTN